MGILYGKYDLLDSLKAYKVRPESDLPPGKFEVGAASFEWICGVKGALDYIAWLGKEISIQDRYLFDPIFAGGILVLALLTLIESIIVVYISLTWTLAYMEFAKKNEIIQKSVTRI